MPDDRAAFLSKAEQRCIEMGRDRAVFDGATETLVAIDRYDYSYLRKFLGVPIIQLPADIMATQEIMWETKPTLVIETGVTRGGSVIMMNAMMKLLGRGKVIGIDIDIREHNRDSIESHPLSDGIVLIEGSSTSEHVLDQVRAHIGPDDRVMVVLDSDHTFEHVLEECRRFGPLVTPGCFLVVADTLVGYLKPEQAPRADRRSRAWVPGDDPLAASRQYLTETDRFEVDPVVNGKLVLSSSPDGYLRCVG